MAAPFCRAIRRQTGVVDRREFAVRSSRAYACSERDDIDRHEDARRTFFHEALRSIIVAALPLPELRRVDHVRGWR